MDDSPSQTAPRSAHLAGLFLVTCSTLLLQVTWTRVLSVSLWYHFAFLVVSTALLGFGLSGVLLTVSRRLAAVDLDRGLAAFAGVQGVCTILGFLLANRIPFAPFSLLGDPRQVLLAPLYVLCIAAPFVASGLCAVLLLSRWPQHAGRIYFFDLLGAGTGCFVIVMVMPVFGGSGSIVACAALAAAAALCFAPGRGRVLAAGLLFVLIVALPWADRLAPLRISHTKTTGGEGPPEAGALFSGWNTFSRVDVVPAPWGRRILIDAGTAMTRMPRVTAPPQATGPVRDERALVLGKLPGQSVLVIGSGGGWDVLAALRNGARRVVAVEVNPLINHLVTGPMAPFVGHLFSDPRVELHTAEARSFVRASRETFDVILASHTVSNAATASGALSLAESYIMTVEAFADYLSHLTPEGFLWLTRPESQLARTVATACDALSGRGIEDAGSRVIVFAGAGHPSFYGGVAVSMRPLGPSEVESAAAQLARSRLRALYLPGRDTGPAIFRQILRGTPAAREDLYRESPTHVRPATDDQPFFNQRTRWSAMTPSTLKRVFDQGQHTRLALEDQPVAEAVLLVVLVQSLLLAGALILAPLLFRHRRLAGTWRSWRLLLYFLCLGLGFILCEIGLIQRLTLFLGQPVYTFAVVVGTLLIASGLGSAVSNRLVPNLRALRGRLLVILLGVSALITCFALFTPPLLRLLLGLSLPGRAAVTALLLLPLGFALGMPFPLGLRHAGSSAPRIIPWAWGLNAVASVVGSVAAIILATVVGFTGVFLIAAGIYVTAALLDPVRSAAPDR
jgi:hypothetical protein